LVFHNDVSGKVFTPEDLIGYKQTSLGELVVNRMRATIGLIAATKQPGLVSPDYSDGYQLIRGYCRNRLIWIIPSIIRISGA
jgi:hypothetical protein